MTNRLSAILLLFTIFSWNLATSQTAIQGYTSTWFTLINRFQFANKWSITNELHERTGKFFDTQAQFLERPSIDFLMNKHVEFSIGYSYINVRPYSPYSQPIPKIENNLWEQVLIKHEVGRVQFQSRFRQENRWSQRIIQDEQGVFKVDGTTYANRFRYRYTLIFDIVRFKKENTSIFFQGFDEVWLTQNSKLIPTDFARNWLFLGLGYKFSSSCNIQLGFMNQYDKIGNGSFISTPIIQTTFIKNFNVAKNKKEVPN